MPSWYEKRVRRYEQMRFDQEPKRRTLPFAWGAEHIGGNAVDPHPEEFFDRYVADAVAHSDAWYAIEPATDYALAQNVLTFSSEITSPWPENNRVHAQFFPSRRRSPNGTRGPAVVVLAQWNAKWHEQQNVCLWLAKLGLTAVKMSLPYHDRRSIPDHPRADHLIGPNIGLTMQAGRQAVLDVRRTLRWLEQQGYGPLGVLGTSIGSAIGFITMCHEPALRAGAFLHASTYFGDVVATGLTTKNRLGADFSGRHHARAAAPLLVADQPVSVHRAPARSEEKDPADHSEVRSHVLAGVHGSAGKQIA